MRRSTLSLVAGMAAAVAPLWAGSYAELEFSLESRGGQEYRCTYLSEDATAVEALPVTERTETGWKKRFVLFPGCSILLDARGGEGGPGAKAEIPK